MERPLELLGEGEAWDSIGSRRFVYDIARYGAADSCNNSVAAAESPTGREMCLSPLLPSVAFQGLGAGLENLDAVVAHRSSIHIRALT